MVTQVSAERVKQLYPAGVPVEVHMIRSHPVDIYPGTKGEVMFVDDASAIHIRLRNGNTLTAQYGEDYVTRVFDLVRKRK